MKDIIFKSYVIIIITLFISSCVKKQIKKSNVPDVPNVTEETTIRVSTVAVSTSEIVEDTDTINIATPTDILLETVNFDFDKYELSQEAKELLSKNAKKIIENAYTINIEGHCDERGTQQYNLSLGQKRANVVRDYYIMLGVNPNKIETVSFGEEKPLCSEQTEECWAKNRRAETRIME